MKIDYRLLSENIVFNKCHSARWWTSYTLELKKSTRIFGIEVKGTTSYRKILVEPYSCGAYYKDLLIYGFLYYENYGSLRSWI